MVEVADQEGLDHHPDQRSAGRSAAAPDQRFGPGQLDHKLGKLRKKAVMASVRHRVLCVLHFPCGDPRVEEVSVVPP